MREDASRWTIHRSAAAPFLLGGLAALAAVPLLAETGELSRPQPVIQERLIERVSLSKRVVCPNEPVTVTVKTRGTKAQAAGLYVSVNGKTGNPVDVSYGSEGTYKLVVEAFDKQGRIDHGTSSVRVIECGAFESVDVAIRPLGADRVAFTAEPKFNAPRPRSQAEEQARLEELEHHVPPTVASCHWNFGDGKTADTAEAYAEHDYGGRDQRSSVNTSYVVNVTVETADGHRINGGATVTLTNVYAQNRIERGVIVPSVSIDEVSAEEGRPPRPRLTVRNLEDIPFDLQRVVLHKLPCDDKSEASDVEVSPEMLLGQSRFDAGETSVDITLPDELASAATCRIVADGEGETTSGQPVRFSVGMATRINGEAGRPLEEVVGDKKAAAAMRAELDAAARLLGRDPLETGVRITDDELHLLRVQGRLRGRPAGQADTLQPDWPLMAPAAPEPSQ